MMTTLVILSMGIVLIYKSFFLCVDYQSHIAIRLHANILLDNKLVELEQSLRDLNDLSAAVGAYVIPLEVQNKKIDFECVVNVVPVEEYQFLYQVQVSLSWKERSRPVSLTRSCYLSSISSGEDVSINGQNI